MRRTARVRLALAGGEAFDAILDHDTARLEPMADGADALLTADPRTLGCHREGPSRRDEGAVPGARARA